LQHEKRFQEFVTRFKLVVLSTTATKHDLKEMLCTETVTCDASRRSFIAYHARVCLSNTFYFFLKLVIRLPP